MELGGVARTSGTGKVVNRASALQIGCPLVTVDGPRDRALSGPIQNIGSDRRQHPGAVQVSTLPRKRGEISNRLSEGDGFGFSWRLRIINASRRG